MNINEIQKDGINNIFSDNKKVSTDGQGKVGSAAEGIFLGAYFSVNNEKANSDIVYGKEKGVAAGTEGGGEATDKPDANQIINQLKENITPESYSQMETLGLAPKEDEMGNIVTVNERIQIQLATYCEDYAGSTLSVNSADVKEVLGAAASVSKVENTVSNALSMAEDVQSVSKDGAIPEDAKAYLLKNSLEPTIENVYKAVHSSGIGTNSDVNVIDEAQWQSMKSQAAAVYAEAGLPPTEENLQEGKWMVENNIPLTAENVALASRINNVDMDMSQEKMTQYIEDGMAAGISAEDVVLSEGGTIIEKAQDMVNTVNSVTRDDLNYIVTNNNDLSFKALKEAKEAVAKEQLAELSDDYETQAKYTKAERVVFEAQLMMTVGSCVQMMKLGVNIDTMSLSQVVDNLKNMESGYYQAFFNNTGFNAGASDISMMQETMYSVSYVSYQMTYNPYEFVGKAYVNESKTISSFTAMQMEMTYAGVGTEVRSDLGDTIGKAFAGIDSLLEVLGIEANEANKKAARILGYNSMEINEENIAAIKNLSAQLEALTENLTPQTVAELIKNGVNTLNTEISVLNEKLEIINENNDKGTKEKYSKFLWKLDKTGELTEDERNAYIGMYRLITWVGKNDGNVIGALYKQGSEVNLKNLLTVARTKKVKGIDATLDDAFGVTEEITKLDDIERDINKVVTDTNIIEYAESLMKKSGEIITPEGISDILSNANPGQMTPEQVYDVLNMQTSKADSSYIAEQINEMQQTGAISEETVKNIIDNNIPMTVNNLLSAGMLYQNTKSAFNKIRQMTDTSAMEEAVTSGSEEELKEAIENVAREVADRVDRLSEEEPSAYDYFKEAILANNIMTVMVNMSRNRNYVVESTINDKSTIIKLSVEQGLNNKVKISANNEELGEVKVELTIIERALVGTISAEDENVHNILNDKLDTLIMRLKDFGFESVQIQITSVVENTASIDNSAENGDINEGNNSRLYDMAKEVIAWL